MGRAPNRIRVVTLYRLDPDIRKDVRRQSSPCPFTPEWTSTRIHSAAILYPGDEWGECQGGLHDEESMGA